MEQVQNAFYILATIYMVLNILILVGIGFGVYLIVKAVLDIRKQVTEKLKDVEEAMKHPDELVSSVGSTIVKAGLRNARNMFRKGKEKAEDVMDSDDSES